MSRLNFDWDKYFSKAKWNEVRENSPFLMDRRLPSLVNREAGLVYLSSLDIGLSISDEENLIKLLPEVKSIFEGSVDSKNYYKAAVASSDFATIKNLLSDLDVDSSDFELP